MKQPSRFLMSIVYFCFFLSGCAALIYENLWVRQLTLVLGHTTIAVSIVLSAFMAGLASGSYYGGRLASKSRKAQLLLLFSGIEFLIAITALISALGIQFIHGIIPKLGVWSIPVELQNIVWFLCAFIVLIAPTFLMGMTLPLLTERLSIGRENEPDRVGSLYGINTLGAMVGCLAAGFYLVFQIGMNKTYMAAAALNILSAISILFVSKLSKQESDPLPDEKAASDSLKTAVLSFETARGKIMGILFVTGFSAMVCQVAWTRAFSLVIGSSTFAFTIILLTFLLGLSLGSLSFRWIQGIFSLSFRVLSAVLAALALSIIMYLPFFNKLPFYFSRMFHFMFHSPAFLHGGQFVLCAMVTLPPTFLMGLLLPWSVVMVTGEKSQGLTVGALYTANTVGNIFGAVVSGLVLVPWLGTENSLVVAAWLYGLAAAVCLVFDQKERATPLIWPVSGLLVLLFLTAIRPKWDPYILSSGPFIYATDYSKFNSYEDYYKDVHQNKILYYKDGHSINVAVFETAWGARFLRVNGKTDASTAFDMRTQLLQGYLPFLLHSGVPKKALVIGFGSGVTAGALASSPTIEKVDCVELEKAVAGGASYFKEANNNITEDPRFKFTFTDARHFLVARPETYDIITSEPSNPWIAGIANLFTKEAFELVKTRLADDGIFCQWFHSYSMGQNDFKMVMNTFASVFPHAMLFTTGERDFFLVGSKKEWRIDYNEMAARMAQTPKIKENLVGFRMDHPFTLVASSFLLDDDDFRRFSQGMPLHEDDRPTLEFTAPRFLHKKEDEIIIRSLLSAKTKSLPTGLTGLKATKEEWAMLYNLAGEAFMRFQRVPEAEQMFSKALSLDPAYSRTWTNVGRIHDLRERHLQAEQAYKKALALDAAYAPAWFYLGMLYVDQGLLDRGIDSLESGLRRSPGDPMGSFQLARLYVNFGKIDKARRVLRKALEKPIDNVDLYEGMVEMLKHIESEAAAKKTV